MHRVSDLDTACDNLSKFDMMSIPGFALSIDAAPSTPMTRPDFFTYMISVSGPIIPSISRLFLAESTNDYPVSTYYRVLPALSAQLPDKEHTLMHSLVHIRPNGTFLETLSTPLPTHSIPSSDTDASAHIFKYKPIAKKVKSVPVMLPKEFCTTRKIIGDPLVNMPTLPMHPLDFVPTGQYNTEAHNIIDTNHPRDFLLPEECKLMHHFMMLFKCSFAWNETQKGSCRQDFFPLIKIPVILHVPWALLNIPIPPGIYNNVVKIIRDKIASETYEPSSSSYRLRWFTVLKKNGKLHIVHNLQLLNAVTICDSAMPPFTKQLAELFGGRSCFGLLDLFVGYNKRPIDINSRDLTTFPTPFSTYRLTSVPMGWVNAVPAFRADVTFTLEPEIPHITIPFLNEAGVKGPPMRYELPDGTYETISDNSGIRRFI